MMITENATVNKIIIPGMYAIAGVLGVEFNMVVGVVGLAIIDMFTGVGAMAVLNERFVTRRLFGGLISKFLMLMLPLTIVLIGMGIGVNMSVLVQASIGVLVVSEGISIIENLMSISKGKRVQSHDVITPTLGAIKRILEITLNQILKKIGGHIDDK